MIKLFTTTAVAALVSVSAHATLLEWGVELNTENEPHVVTNADGAVGFANVFYDDEANVLNWNITNNFGEGSIEWDGLSGEATAAHFHFGEPGEAGGVFLDIFANSDELYTDADLGGSFGSATLTEEQEALFLSSSIYINVHTAENPAGEIRGQLFEAADVSPVPVPAGLPLALTGLAALGVVARRRK